VDFLAKFHSRDHDTELLEMVRVAKEGIDADERKLASLIANSSGIPSLTKVDRPGS
jgi:hypothetical protein